MTVGSCILSNHFMWSSLPSFPTLCHSAVPKSC